jgi:hypothetical protein
VYNHTTRTEFFRKSAISELVGPSLSVLSIIGIIVLCCVLAIVFPYILVGIIALFYYLSKSHKANMEAFKKEALSII